MSIVEEEIIGSQSEESEAVGTSDDNTDEVLALFGVEKEEEDEKSFNDKTPAIEDVKEEIESKTMRVKHNKEEVEVDISDDKLTDHLQRSLALDKERERRVDLEKSLDRAAKLAGFNSHSELVANLDRIEQEQQEKEKNAFNETRQK